ncbi:MAG: DUF1631 family protein [Gammaproteobacteria bacterium]
MTETAKGSLLADIKAASAVIRQAIADADGPLPPHFLVEFLLSQWRRVLALTHHRVGPDDPAWRGAVDTTNRLLMSVLPVTSVEQRTALSKSLPQLIRDIKQGAQLGNIDPVAMDLFLKQLGELHLAKLDPRRPLDKPYATDLSDTIAMDVRDPRYRALLDRLDGADGVEHIEV